ncbi:unnamed protein product [Cylindrotheca closterium]|uniref:Uncharacterized protein n=1 Tax=Cylindrotheca closterium TaxID=2856 RepID=A0AAD2G4E1_9STRA|nr:unnamed protein product [Cylindrotheca closterium]
MISLTVSTFDHAADVSDYDENAIPNDEQLASSTRAALKESIIQVSFAEQTASEMRQILSDWNSAAIIIPDKRHRQPMRRNSLVLMDVAEEGHKGRRLSVPSPMKGKTDVPSPTYTLQTELMDSESEMTEESYLNESIRVDDSFVCDEDDSPQISFLPSSDVLQQSAAVVSIVRNTKRQISEVDRTMHATRYDPVMVELQSSHLLLKINDDFSKQDKVSQHHYQARESLPSPTNQTAIENQRAGTKKEKRRRRQHLLTYVVIPIALSVVAAKLLMAYSEAEEEGQ